MTIEEKYRIAVIMMSLKIRITFENPNSDKSKQVAENLGKKTGIPYLEIHRFHNAVLNDNLVNSFTEKRAGEVAWALCKTFLETETLDTKLRGQLSAFANDQEVSFNDVLETVRVLFHEIIDDKLSPQKKA